MAVPFLSITTPAEGGDTHIHFGANALSQPVNGITLLTVTDAWRTSTQDACVQACGT
jgi:hypothetical protein